MRPYFGGTVTPPYEFHERIAILMEACDYTEPQAIEAVQRQAREAESRRMVREKQDGR